MEPTLAEIRMFAGNFAPRSWALCEGQILPISSNQALFSLLGTTYGGDGRTSFALPDLRGRAAIHAGTGNGLSDRRLGAKLGAEETTLTVAQMPAHTHGFSAKLRATSEKANTNSPVGALLANDRGKPVYDQNDPANVDMGSSSIGGGISNTGNGVSMSNMQPSIAINFIICIQGLFPSRN